MESVPVSNSVQNIPEQVQKESCLIPLTRVTTLSKYLSLTLFVLLPFLGFWIGMQYPVQNSSLVTDESGEPSNTQNEVTDTVHQSTSAIASSADIDKVNCF